MYMNFKELLKDWSPDQVIEFKNYLSENIKSIISVSNGCALLVNNQNGNPTCPNCGSNMWKNKNQSTKIYMSLL